MKMDTPFEARLAELGAMSRTGVHLSLRGQWEVRENAPVTHAARIGDETYFPTVIAFMTGLRTHAGVLYCTGMGPSWLPTLLEKGTHALSMDMENMVVEKAPGISYVVQGRVAGALIVQASAYGWTGVTG